MVQRIDGTYLIMAGIMFYQETNTCLVESIVNSCSFSKSRWYVLIMITILGKKRWEALPLHGTKDIDGTYTSQIILIATQWQI